MKHTKVIKMSASSEEVSILEKKYAQIILLNYGMPHEYFFADKRAQKNLDQSIPTCIIEISPDTNTFAWPENLPKIDEKTKVIINAHGKPASNSITSDVRERMSAAELAQIIVENIKPGTMQLRVSVEICNGGTGESVESHDESFAAHLARELCALGVENSVISAGLGTMYTSAQGRSQVAVEDFERRQVWLKMNEGIFLGEDKDIYLSLFEFSPSRGKSPGAKVILTFNKEKGFTQTYPYGMHQKDESEAAIQAIENYKNAHNAYNAIKNKAIKVFDSVLLEMGQLPSYKNLFENSLFLDCMKKLKEDLKQCEMYDSKTIANYIGEAMQNFKKNVPKESEGVKYHLLAFRFNNDFKKKIEQNSFLKVYLDLQIELSNKCRAAISKIETHIFDIDKKRERELITIGASTVSYDKHFIAECHETILKESEDETILMNLKDLVNSNSEEPQTLFRSSSRPSCQSENPFIFLHCSSGKSTQTNASDSTQLRPKFGQ